MSLRGPLLLLLAAAVIGAVLLVSGNSGGEGRADDPRPNIVFVLSDDQPDNTFGRRMMPRTFAALGGAVDLSDAIAAPPLCCPYRAGVISGQYPHNHGVEMSRPGYESLRDKDLVLPEFLREAGYETGFVGKYLNGTTAAIGTEPAPGWDRWAAFAGPPSYADPELSVDGTPRRFQGRTSEVLTDEANRFLDENRDSGQPFFLWLAHYAPHPFRTADGPCSGNHIAPALPDDRRVAERFRFPRGPNWNREPTGKPPWAVDAAERLGPEERREIVNRWRCALGAVQEVDRSVAAVARTLERNGQLEDTLFVFGSDNGTNYGEHQLERKKGIYEEKLQVPVLIQAPEEPSYRATAGSRRAELVSQVDLMATFVDLADAEPCVGDRCRRLDGRSLAELLRDPATPEWAPDRAIPIKTGTCWIRAFRTPSIAFIDSEPDSRKNDPDECRWPPSGFAELYRLDRDPDQLANLADRIPPGELARLQQRLAEVQRCSGIAGRDARLADHPFCE